MVYSNSALPTGCRDQGLHHIRDRRDEAFPAARLLPLRGYKAAEYVTSDRLRGDENQDAAQAAARGDAAHASADAQHS